MERRKFLITSASVAGGLAIGGYTLLRAEDLPNPLEALLADGQIALTPYVIIRSDGISIIAPRAEMGQGIQSTLAALVAEELDVALESVEVMHGPPSDVYRNNKLYGQEVLPKRLLRRAGKRLGIEFLPPQFSQLTGAQSSLRDGYVKMRKTGAAARQMLLQAAAKQYGVSVDQLKTDLGQVFLPNGRKVAYTDLIESARDIKAPEKVKLKPREQWKKLGSSQPRADMAEKCTGTAEYGIDVRLPDMLYASVLFSPFIGSGLESFDASRAEEVQGYVKTVPFPDGLVVIATNTWYAQQAAKRIEVKWKPSRYPMSMAEHRAAVEEPLGKGQGQIARLDGDVDQVLEKEEVIERSYSVPYLSHATMEPMNAVAWLQEEQLDIWAGNQNPLRARYYGAKIAELSEDQVKVHTTFMGGAFGRRLESDFVEIAVFAACAVKGKPVKVSWTREGDLQHGIYRPIASAKLRAAVKDKEVLAFDLQLSAPSLFSSAERRFLENINTEFPEQVDKSVLLGMSHQTYQLPNYRIQGFPAKERLLPVGWSRGVGETQNVFFHETALDELAHSAGRDPLELRLSLIEHEASRAVLEAVKKMSNWDNPLPEGHARGMAFAISSDAPTAQVVEIRQSEKGIHLEKIYIAVDVGIALDPRNIEAQVKGGVIYGLDSGINSEISVKDGAVVESNYHQYPLLRIHQIPEIEVHIHQSEEQIFGVGEAGVPTNPPALGNALFALTGKRVRDLPFRKSFDFA
ncbi:xanthine dehydrogenase family protein molybdopterin-binding subunit [Aureicoccus marinus]|uniref:Aldehyde oxidase/xanthine dehydrogenase a/b hammerhead domain-containing protein n=1 Tax=Aureicoccus marinus TaxID=754435 RepID=A0A2S7T5U5_9FLAO|nr:molybdopterin cofactor-binding domain-containing protein [Aureicoccus marinus]PQJ15302.1 hypothetical protein BST99_05740 [Aureicoccus marinus]